MTFKLKLREDPVWVESLTDIENAGMMSQVHLKGENCGSGSHVSVPAILLVAVSPLARNILMTDQAPQYHPPVINVSSISGEALQIMVEILVTGKGSVTVTRLGEIQDVFKMFGIKCGLVCSRPQRICADVVTDKDIEMDNYQLDIKTEDTDLNENHSLVKPFDHLNGEYVETSNLEIIVKIEASDLPFHKTDNSEQSATKVLHDLEPHDVTQVSKLDHKRSKNLLKLKTLRLL